MGTRSLTFVYDGDFKKPNLIMYRQMDGYPGGHGLELAEFLKPIHMVNGLPIGGDQAHVANGAACLAAQIVVHFKTECGGIYLCNRGGDHGQDYEYVVRASVEQGIEVTCRAPGSHKTLFKGNVADFETWCKGTDA